MDTDEWCQKKAVLIPTIAILAVIFVIGAIGNICTCLVIIKTKSLHTHANYCLLSLACSDMLLLFLACPVQVYHFINCGASTNFMCKFGFFIKEFYGFASIFIICAFTAERWLAVRHPLRNNVRLRNFCYAFALVSTFAMSIVTTLRMGDVSVQEVEQKRRPKENKWTKSRKRKGSNFIKDSGDLANLNESNAPKPPNFIKAKEWKPYDFGETLHIETSEYTTAEKCVGGRSESTKYTQLIIFILSYVIPVIMLATMCFQIAASAHSTSVNTRTECSRKPPSRMIKLLVAVVVCFLICWSPHQIGQLLDDFYVLKMEKSTLDTVISISACFYYLNCAVDPILYNMFSKNFRKALLHLISGGGRLIATANPT